MNEAQAPAVANVPLSDTARGDAPLPMPTLGRIVIFTFPEGNDPSLGQVAPGRANECPAVITRVWGQDGVNLHLLPDHDQVAAAHGQQMGRPTSVCRGTGGRTWRWPGRA